MFIWVDLITWAFVYVTFQNKTKNYSYAMAAALMIICEDVDQHDVQKSKRKES